jgi:hypothetical protein
MTDDDTKPPAWVTARDQQLAQAAADARALEETGIRAVLWILFIPAAAGFVWLWANIGDMDILLKLVIVGSLGMLWTGLVWVVMLVLFSIFGLGYLMVRGTRKRPRA